MEDRGLQFGESLYEVVAITGGEPRMLAEHAARMRAGAGEMSLRGAPDDATWSRMVEQLVEREGTQEGLLYAQLTGGTAPREHVPDGEPEPTFFAYLRPHRFPRADDVSRGIRAITVQDLRWSRCDLKTTMLLPAVWAKREARRRGATEALIVGDGGEVREGGSSNVLLVEQGAIVTPEQTQHLLPGITRPLIGAIASEAGIEMRSEPVTLERARAADELIVVSTAILVMPLVAVDDEPVGGGATGPVGRDLAARLRRRWGLSEA
ncbi:MAG: aminotransferase class IV [Polyangiales bacterium]